ncbi:MAG: AMP-binding protein [Pseudohongiellaceae bacterium]
MSSESFPYLHQESDRTALVEGDTSYTYSQVNQRINRFATGLLGGKADLEEERVAFFLPASLDYVTTMHGVWRAGGITVPLNVASAVAELDHYLSSASVTRMVTSADYIESLGELCQRLNVALYTVDELLAETAGELPHIDDSRRAMMLFTSGTTNKPKGVVSTHKTIRAQITTLLEAWAWTEDDVIPLFLPLHHIHGIINILSCGLWAGATVHLFSKFDIPTISNQVVDGTYNVFMAVPTIYVKLIQYFDTIDAARVQQICAGFKAMRLNISGSAACPVKLFNQWQDLTGQVLLAATG